MNFDDTPEEAAFRTKIRTWIDANAPKELLHDILTSGLGDFNRPDARTVAAAKAWQKKKFDAGWACLDWPKTHGGGEATPIQRVIWSQEEGPYGELHGIFIICHSMCGPTMMAFATNALNDRYLRRMASGELICCQLFSEPAAGSDLAGLRTRAERAKDGSGDWIINGQKIWTSGAQVSDLGLLLARTDPTLPKHKGLTMYLLDMKAPGVEVRPVRQANGLSGFNEVFFTDVRIPDENRIGNVNDGWRAALTTLMNERMTVFTGLPTGFTELFDFCCAFNIDGKAAIDDPVVRAKLAKWAVRNSGLKYTGFRSISALSQGREPGPENSIGKMVAASTQQEIAMFAVDLQGQAGMINDPESTAAGARFQAALLRSPGYRIEAGSDEILRNIIAERVLGLPADIRLDKDIAFNAIPTTA
jgi:alkylation response protein AidB-like acyl-CoA dehydrogenase